MLDQAYLPVIDASDGLSGQDARKFEGEDALRYCTGNGDE